MKKRLGLIACLMAAIIGACGLSTACAPGGQSNSSVLWVYNYNGGVGDKWLDAVIERFEADKADAEYEEGKTGVKIETYSKKQDFNYDVMSGSEYSVFFLEGVNYNVHQLQNRFLNISDMVKAQIPGEAEGTSIESKLDENTKSALKGLDGEYYVLPHYQSLAGVTYNRTLFEQKGWFFVDNQPADFVITDETDSAYGMEGNLTDGVTASRTRGPNGVYENGEGDDGLPSSVEEFKQLCEYIKETEGIPFIFYGGTSGTDHSYVTSFANAMYVALEGYDGAMANYLFHSNGTTTDIVTGFDQNDIPQTEPVEITKADNNFYKVYQQESRYYVLDFINYIFSEGCYARESTNGTEHTKIHEVFMRSASKKPIDNRTKNVAMLLDGSYWENEAKDSSAYNNAINADADVANYEFEFMPLPTKCTGTVSSESEGRQPVTVDANSAYAFINANVATYYNEGIKQLALDFLQYCYTDTSLKEFTVKSSVTKNVNYSLDAGDKQLLSHYSNSVYKAYETGKVVIPISGEPLFINNQTVLSIHPNNEFWHSKVGNSTYTSSFGAFKVAINTPTVKEYFLGMAKSSNYSDWLAIPANS